MNLLGAALYDPAVAVAKATSALLALTAFDTTNLRLAITVPAHGKVRFRLRCMVTGATTCPVLLLGALNGAAVVGRVAPSAAPVTAPAATQNFVLDAEFTASGLTPGAMNVDAAYAVQVVVAATNIKFGGPNTNAGANAWGAFVFEAWDPQPLPTAAPGAANGLQIAGANAATTYASLTSTGAFTVNGTSAVSQTGDAFARLGAPVGASHSADVAAVKADTAAVKVKTDFLPSAAAGAAGGVFIAGSNAATTVNFTGSLSGSVGSVTGAVTLPAIPANWLTAAGINAGALNGKGDWVLASSYATAPSAASIRAEMDANSTKLANLDATVSSRSTFAGGAVASVTGNVGGSVASVTADVGITQAAADKVWGSAARSLTTFGTLVADIAAAVWGATTRVLTAGTNIVLAKGTGITGLNDIAAAAIVSSGAITTAGGKVSGVALVDTVTTYTGNTPQTGDTFARVGAAGAGLTALGDTRFANLDANVSSRLAAADYSPGGGADTATVIAATNAIAAQIGAAGAGLTALGDARLVNLDARVSSRSTFGRK